MGGAVVGLGVFGADGLVVIRVGSVVAVVIVVIRTIARRDT